MDFSFTPDQETLRNHIRELLDDVCPPDYAKAATMRRVRRAKPIRRWPSTAGSA